MIDVTIRSHSKQTEVSCNFCASKLHLQTVGTKPWVWQERLSQKTERTTGDSSRCWVSIVPSLAQPPAKQPGRGPQLPELSQIPTLSHERLRLPDVQTCHSNKCFVMHYIYLDLNRRDSMTIDCALELGRNAPMEKETSSCIRSTTKIRELQLKSLCRSG